MKTILPFTRIGVGALLLALSLPALSAPNTSTTPPLAPMGYGPAGPAQFAGRDALPPSIKSSAAASRSLTNDLPPDIAKMARESHRKVLANTFGERAQMLRQLGLDRRQTGYLYYFVSTSMPPSLVRDYALDAIWTGGVLVFRGVLKGHTIGWFITHEIRPLTRAKVASPSVTIDPRLYETFGITHVPAMVYTTTQPESLCATEVVRHLTVKGHGTFPYHVCAPASPATYWKLSGSVGAAWALRQFKAAHAPGVSVLLAALRSGGFPASQQPTTLSTKGYAEAAGPGSLSDVEGLMGGAAALPSSPLLQPKVP